MNWAGVDLHKPLILFDPEQERKAAPQPDPRADAVRVTDLMDVPRRVDSFPRRTADGYDWRNESRGSGGPLQGGGGPWNG